MSHRQAFKLKENEKRDLDIAERERERQHELAEFQLSQGNEISSVSWL